MKTQNALLPASPTLVVEDKHMALVAETTSVTLTAWPAVSDDSVERFPDRIHAISEAHQPSRMPFFRHLAALPKRKVSDPAMLGRIYLVYQAAMHATRAAVYYMPHLDAPALRKRKLQIYVDDDGLPGGDTHHYQLARAFRGIGATLPLDDEEFGDPDELCRHLDRSTAKFVRLAKELYARSLGPWCIVEVMSDNWMHALAKSLSVHHPKIVDAPYFADCFGQHVEERHAAEALGVTQTVLRARPYLLDETLRDAETMAEALDGVWERLDAIVRAAE
jgi:pyrroloquinoline quinone (PQQ) biosynthesis protein C